MQNAVEFQFYPFTQVENPVHPSFKEIVEEIVARHHSLLRKELPIISAQLDALSAECGGNEAFVEAQQIYQKVRNKVEAHLKDEETILFPTGIALESGACPPPSEIDLVERLKEMEKEHEGCGNALSTVSQRLATLAPGPVRDKLLATLQLVQEDLRIHVEKENSLVHPRFIELFAAQAH